MKKKDLQSIKGLEVKGLREQVQKIKQELSELVIDKNTKKLKNVKVISGKRKDLAQLLTVIRQKELLADLKETK